MTSPTGVSRRGPRRKPPGRRARTVTTRLPQRRVATYPRAMPPTGAGAAYRWVPAAPTGVDASSPPDAHICLIPWRPCVERQIPAPTGNQSIEAGLRTTTGLLPTLYTPGHTARPRRSSRPGQICLIERKVPPRKSTSRARWTTSARAGVGATLVGLSKWPNSSHTSGHPR